MKEAGVDKEVDVPTRMRRITRHLPALAVAALTLAVATASAQGSQTRRTIDLPAGPGPLDNPLKGYAAYAAAGETHFLPTTMAYVDASWRDLEPEEGQYRFDEWEKREWETPLAHGKHIVFRVWLDYPHAPLGLPQWLIDKGVRLTPYTDHGGGKSPDYENPDLQAGLLRLIAKLGERYDRNPRVAFVQVGLLGFWGEFHTWPRTELFASEATQKKVVSALHAAFPDKELMGRNPAYPSLRLPWMGFHDDMIPEDTLPPDDWKFLPSMKTGGVLDNWKVAPTGGEMVPGAAVKWLGEGWEDTKKAVRDAHFTWIGPYCPSLVRPPNETYRQRGEDLIRMLGYEYRLTRLSLPTSARAGSRAEIQLEGVNQGVAPFYYPWAVELALLDSSNQVVKRRPVAVDIRRWLPGPFRFRADLPTGVAPGRYRLALGIVDPWTGKPAVAFANRLDHVQGRVVLGSVNVVR